MDPVLEPVLPTVRQAVTRLREAVALLREAANECDAHDEASYGDHLRSHARDVQDVADALTAGLGSFPD